MKTFLVLLSVLPSVAFGGSVSTVRGARAEKDESLQRFAHEVERDARALAGTSLPPAMVATVPVTTSASAGEIKASSYVFQWGAGRNGCNYTLPQVTLSCGAGGTITLGRKAATVKGCVYRTGSTIVCTTEASPTTNPQLYFVCFGTTAAQLAGSVQIPASQATCSSLVSIFPQSQVVFRGGSTNLYGALGRYCKNDKGSIYVNYNYTCGSGSKTVNQGVVQFCNTGASCTTRLACNSSTPEKSCRGSCIDKIGALSILAQDSRATCTNAGPRPSTLFAGLHQVTWSSSHPTCTSAANSVTAACGAGGILNIYNRGPTVSTCTSLRSNTIRCTRNSTSATVVFYCYGRNATARTATVFLPKDNATNCNKGATNANNVAYQALVLQRYCGNTTLISRPSKVCANQTQLQGSVCIAKNECRSTAKSNCTIALDAVAMSDATNDPTCTVTGPKSVTF